MQKPINNLDLYSFCPKCSNKLKLKTRDKTKIKQCSNCGFIFWNNPIACCSIVLHQENKVLMLQRAKEPFKNYWVLPGGFMNIDETPQDAIKRETKEETGLDIEIDGIVGAYRIDNDPRGIHIDIIYHTEVSGQTPVLNKKEDINWVFFPIEQLPKDIAYKHKNAIMDWIALKENK